MKGSTARAHRRDATAAQAEAVANHFFFKKKWGNVIDIVDCCFCTVLKLCNCRPRGLILAWESMVITDMIRLATSPREELDGEDCKVKE